MKTLRQAVAPTVLAAALAAAAPAAGQEAALVPPENSAVTQYTEAFPTSRGPKDVHDGQGSRRSPGEVLGERNARRLDEQGADGREAAELAVKTAPPAASVQEDAGTQTPATSASPVDRAGGPNAQRSEQLDDRGVAGIGPVRDVSGVDGSSGLDSTLRQAFGTPGDSSDTLLLLIVLATAAWALAYGMRHRQRAS
ncbi:MAG TPA: hypothetical protein VFU04_06355 [Solirubrobacterales bacterium]|nr:hypothetical protein [Solirubrobacterales bacterium]